MNEFYDEFLEVYDEDEDLQLDYDAILMDEPKLESIVQTCIVPSVQQIRGYICILLGCCFFCRLLWTCCGRISRSAEWVQHWISMLCGIASLHGSVGNNFYIVIFLTLNGFVLLQALQHFRYKHIGPIVATVIVTTHILFEVVLRTPEAWNNVRGIQMVATMKIISLAFDVSEDDNKDNENLRSVPTLVPYLGYVFCPASCAIGLWMPYNSYVRSMKKPASGLARSIWWTACNLALALLSLVASNCIAPLMCTSLSWKWLRAFRDASSVRSSHYFISFLSQAALAINGIKWNNYFPQNGTLGFVVSKPWTIEFPRSLSSVARNWNLPMHAWLKKYIFLKVQKYFGGYFLPVLASFVMSSLLHGLHYEIYAVLLSLAFFAYAESVIRYKLANIFDACIKGSSCQRNCSFKYCDKRISLWRGGIHWNMLYVRLANIAFSLLSVFHLTYLGAMLSTKDEGPVNIADGLLRWQKLGYINHWIAIIIFISYHLI